MTSLRELARLNARVAGLALRGRWLTPEHVARGYDRAAATYNDRWLGHLRGVTDELLARLPRGIGGTVLDLGTGTGYVARCLARANPAAKVVGVDVSGGMIEEARQGVQETACPDVEWVVSDMLDFMRKQPAHSAALVVSTWALGYSHPARLIRECARVLAADGVLGFIVNYADTLRRVFRAYQRCMFRFAARVQLAAYPRFPKCWTQLEGFLTRANLTTTWHRDGEQQIIPPPGKLVRWLAQTGILAGFDAMLDLSGEAADYFETELGRDREKITHHYAMAIARRAS